MLGECKSFTAKFEPAFGEIVAAVNPRGRLILLFATLDERLVEAERKKIADSVAQIRSTFPRALVLVLTARELLSNDFPECWKGLEAPYGRWAEQGVVSNGMEGICHATEKLYLGEPKPNEAR